MVTYKSCIYLIPIRTPFTISLNPKEVLVIPFSFRLGQQKLRKAQYNTSNASNRDHNEVNEIKVLHLKILFSCSKSNFLKVSNEYRMQKPNLLGCLPY